MTTEPLIFLPRIERRPEYLEVARGLKYAPISPVTRGKFEFAYKRMSGSNVSFIKTFAYEASLAHIDRPPRMTALNFPLNDTGAWLCFPNARFQYQTKLVPYLADVSQLHFSDNRQGSEDFYILSITYTEPFAQVIDRFKRYTQQGRHSHDQS